jgi:hypothetical protein
MEERPRVKSYFYESEFLTLPEYRLCINDSFGTKIKALSRLGSGMGIKLSHAAAVYGSTTTGEGSGWYESFISYELCKSSISAMQMIGERDGS